MASAGAHLAPWDRGNVQEEEYMDSSQYKEVLNQARVALRNNLRLHDVWPHLQQMGVITQNDEDRMRLNAVNCDSVDRLLTFINTCETWCYHALLRAMALTHQGGLIPQGGLGPEVYMKDVHHTPQQPKQHRPEQHRPEQHRPKQHHLKSATKEIKSHRSVYEQTLMQGSLFDIPSLDLPYDMGLTYIQLLATSDERLVILEDIPPDDILRAMPPKSGRKPKPPPKTALLSGPPGGGKSSFIRFFVYRWSQQEDGSSDWDLIVILNVSTLKLTQGLSPKEHIKEAIQQSLEGMGDKEATMKCLEDDSLKVLVIPDGLDECGSSTVLEMLKELVSSSYCGTLGYTVLCTCRTGLSPIKDSLYNRRMKLEGFKTHEGVEYVQRFYQEIQKPEDDSILDYITSNTEELDHILTNPLCTHILSVVTSDGTLRLVKGQRLGLKKLFDAMERSMRRRQVEKMPEGGSGNVQSENQLEDEIKCFYNFSLWALLKDVRSFDDDLLSRFKIHAQHPYFTFLKKFKYNSALSQVSYWKFNHVTFLEYFSTCALEALPDDLRSALLFTISSDKKFRNTQRILFSALGGDIDQVGKLSDMICVNLITEGQFDIETQKVIDDVKVKAKIDIGLDDLISFLVPGKDDSLSMNTSKAQAVRDTIRILYEDQAELLQRTGFLSSTLESKSGRNLITHIYNCLHEVPEEYQRLIFAKTLNQTMPSTWFHNGTRHVMYSTGGTRWAQVSRDSNHGAWVNIPFSLTDAAEAVHTYGQQHLDRGTGQWDYIWLNLELDRHELDVRGIWGDPIRGQFISETPWSDLLLALQEWQVTADRLILYFKDDFVYDVVGFLKCLQMERTQAVLKRLLVQDEGGRLRIEVYWGHIDSASLLVWTRWYLTQDLVQVWLRGLICRISGTDPGTRQEQHRQVDSLQHTVHNGRQLLVCLDVQVP